MASVNIPILPCLVKRLGLGSQANERFDVESLREEVKQPYRLKLVAALDEIGEVPRQRGRVAAHVVDALGARSCKQLQRRHPDARPRRVQGCQVLAGRGSPTRSKTDGAAAAALSDLLGVGVITLQEGK